MQEKLNHSSKFQDIVLPAAGMGTRLFPETKFQNLGKGKWKDNFRASAWRSYTICWFKKYSFNFRL